MKRIVPLDADTERRYFELFEAESAEKMAYLRRRYPGAAERTCPKCKSPAGVPCLHISTVFGNRPYPTDVHKARIEPEIAAAKQAKIDAKAGAKAAKAQALSERIERGEVNTLTGHCQICEGRFKIQRGRIALHGYNRPGYGFITGKCWGSGELPYEQSCEALRPYLKMLEKRIDDIVRLEANRPDMTTIMEPGARPGKMRTFHRPSPDASRLDQSEWNDAMARYATRLKGEHDATEREITRVSRRIDNWAPRELSHQR